MKLLKTLFLLLYIAFSVQAQTVIENPNVGFSKPEYIQLTKVELTSVATILSLQIKIPEYNWVRIHDKSFITPVGDTTKYYLIKAEGIDMDKRNYWEEGAQEEINCRLFFPKLDKSLAKIDFGEPVTNSFEIYDIEIGDVSNQSILPDELLGNWFSKEKGKWTYSFLDTLAIFNNQVWKYLGFEKADKNYIIELSDGNKQKTLICKTGDKNNLYMSTAGEAPQLFTRNADVYYNTLNQQTASIKTKVSNVTVYKGIIKNYRPDIGTFVSLKYRNEESKENFAKVADIEADGSFFFELEISKPYEINVMLPTGTGSIYLVPGSNIFHLANSGNRNLPWLFMGNNASLASRQSLIQQLRKDKVVSNNLAALSANEKDEFLKTASYDDIINLKTITQKNIKVKDNLFYVPRRNVRMKLNTSSRNVYAHVSSVGFWISNEITTREYREFASDIISNPEGILRWKDRRYDSSISSYEEFTAVEIYSEVAKSLIDSSLEVNVFYEGKLQKENIIRYLNDERYNDFPIIGVPLKGAQYYCYWLNQKNGLADLSRFLLPNDTNYRILADYLKEIQNSENSPRLENILYKIPKDTIAYLNTNATEWFKPRRERPGTIHPPSKLAVIERWENFGDDIEYIYNDEAGTKTSGFRIIRYAEKEKAESTNSGLIIIILLSIIFCMIIVFIGWKWRVRQRFRKEEQNRKLRELELTAIRSQMNPHFLFNALNSVQNLVQQNKGREAHLYLADFAGLIRKVLNNSEKEEVSLAEELEMIEQYLTLEKLRFEFDFEIKVAAEIDHYNTLIPSMLLQPFVENAVIHGLQNKQGDKQLSVEVMKAESGVQISIEDNGIGRAAAKELTKAKNGKGTKLMKERLEILQEKQGEKYSLNIIDLEIGTRVEILIPEEN